MSTIKVQNIQHTASSTNAIALASNGTATANLTNRQGKNLIINGAMQVAQRSTSSTSSGYQTVDRFKASYGGTDENPTQSQANVASGTTPYSLGFRKSYKFTNGNQTGGAGSADYIAIIYKIEAQDLANSGWNYTSSSSYITLSFWVKSSVAQNFYGYFITQDGSDYLYPFETGSLSADTWTKVTKTIPGNSNIQIDNDNGAGLELLLWQFGGTDYTASGVSLNAWGAYNSSQRMPDNTSTWYTTNDATFELTGVQLEVGSHATDFEHRSYGQELALCQRYYYIVADGREDSQMATGFAYHSNQPEITLHYPVMRASPSLVHTTGTNYYGVKNNNVNVTFNSWLWYQGTTRCGLLYQGSGMGSSLTAGQAYRFYFNSDQAYIHLNAEL